MIDKHKEFQQHAIEASKAIKVAMKEFVKAANEFSKSWAAAEKTWRKFHVPRRIH